MNKHRLLDDLHLKPAMQPYLPGDELVYGVLFVAAAACDRPFLGAIGGGPRPGLISTYIERRALLLRCLASGGPTARPWSPGIGLCVPG